MESQVINVANVQTYFNKGKRCAAVTFHDGTVIKLVVTEADAPENRGKETPVSSIRSASEQSDAK